jgi:hypothetical protein
MKKPQPLYQLSVMQLPPCHTRLPPPAAARLQQSAAATGRIRTLKAVHFSPGGAF